MNAFAYFTLNVTARGRGKAHGLTMSRLAFTGEIFKMYKIMSFFFLFIFVYHRKLLFRQTINRPAVEKQHLKIDRLLGPSCSTFQPSYWSICEVRGH